MSPEEATAHPISLAELEAYGKRADEIFALSHELIGVGESRRPSVSREHGIRSIDKNE